MITTLVALAAVNFPGGNVSDLAKSIADATGQPVIFEAGANERAPRFSYDPSNLNEMARKIQTATGFRRSPGAIHAFHHGKLPGYLFGMSSVSRYGNTNTWIQGGSLPENFLAEGKVTIQHRSGQSSSVSELPGGILPKPIQVHWIFNRSAFKAHVKQMEPLDFMNHLAKAIGGKVLQLQDRFVLDIDAAEIQRRALGTLAAVQADRRYANYNFRDKFEIELSRQGILAIGPAQLSTLLSTQSGRIRFEIPGTMRPAITAYVNAMLAGEAQGSELIHMGLEVQTLQRQRDDGQRRGRNNADRLRNLDPRLIGYAEIDARFRVSLQLATVAAPGRPVGSIRLP